MSDEVSARSARAIVARVLTLAFDAAAFLVVRAHHGRRGRQASAATGVGGDQDDDSAPHSGAAYVLRRAATAWQQEAPP